MIIKKMVPYCAYGGRVSVITPWHFRPLAVEWVCASRRPCSSIYVNLPRSRPRLTLRLCCLSLLQLIRPSAPAYNTTAGSSIYPFDRLNNG